RVKPWAIGIAALLLIGGLFGGFYAYQHRNSNAPVEAAKPADTPAPTQAEASPTAEHAEPASGTVAEEKKPVAVGSPTIVAESGKKNEKSSRKNQKAEKNPAEADDDPAVDLAEQGAKPKPG